MRCEGIGSSLTLLKSHGFRARASRSAVGIVWRPALQLSVPPQKHAHSSSEEDRHPASSISASIFCWSKEGPVQKHGFAHSPIFISVVCPEERWNVLQISSSMSILAMWTGQ